MKNDKPIIITGATGAIGRELAKMLAADGVPMIFACRNTKKANALKQDILLIKDSAQIEIVELDLSSFISIKRFAETIGDRKLSALVNNAGVIAKRFELTEDGWETNVGVNYIGVWMLTNLLRNNVIENGHIVNVISCTTTISAINSDFLCHTKECLSYNRLKKYGESKLALLMATKEMAARFSDLHVSGADPGIVDSDMIRMGKWFDPLADLFFRPFIKSPKKGALPIYRALTDKNHELGSAILYKGTKSKKTITANQFSKELWEQTENLTNM